MAVLQRALLAFVVALFFNCPTPSQGHREISRRSKCNEDANSIYVEDHVFVDLWNNTRHLNEFRGATWQYLKLNALHNMNGVTVLAFPCNQFGLQEPGRNDEILRMLEHIRPGNGYVPNFPIFEKIEVNGENAHPLFQFMREQCSVVSKKFSPKARLFYDPISPNDIEWNFHKFLVDQTGKVFRRYNHLISPESPTLLKDVNNLLELGH